MAGALLCSHRAARNIFLESVVYRDLPRRVFPRISAPTDWFVGDVGMIQAFDCKKKPSTKRVYGYKADGLSCGKHGNFVMFTRPTIPIIGMKSYINISWETTYYWIIFWNFFVKCINIDFQDGK